MSGAIFTQLKCILFYSACLDKIKPKEMDFNGSVYVVVGT